MAKGLKMDIQINFNFDGREDIRAPKLTSPLMMHGSKRRIAHKIIRYFPEHDIYIEPFFGTGSFFLEKQNILPARYNFLNDISLNIFTLWKVLMDDEKRERLISFFENVPVHKEVLKVFSEELPKENDDVLLAAKFLYTQKFSLYSDGKTIKIRPANDRENLLESLKITWSSFIKFATFGNSNAIDFLAAIDKKRVKDMFCYCDPPYLDTRGYASDFQEHDLRQLIEKLFEMEVKFCVSNYGESGTKILSEYGLRKIFIKNIRSIGSRNDELIFVNY